MDLQRPAPGALAAKIASGGYGLRQPRGHMDTTSRERARGRPDPSSRAGRAAALRSSWPDGCPMNAAVCTFLDSVQPELGPDERRELRYNVSGTQGFRRHWHTDLAAFAD